MSLVPSQGTSILIDAPKSNAPPGQNGTSTSSVAPGNGLTSWLVGKFTPWEAHRNRGYQKRWGEYWRLWRGMWAASDRNRLSERSRLIAPALAQAIEMTTAEIEEGLFSKDVWFDVEDDIADEEKLDALIARDNLREDLHSVGVKDAVGEAVLNGAIFGTGIMKMNVEVEQETAPTRDGKTKTLTPSKDEKVRVRWESIRPDEFVPDPAGRCIPEMLGCFHKVKKPLHYVLDKIERKVYRQDAAQFLAGGQFHGSDSDIDSDDPQSRLAADEGDEVEILEYHGKVPVSLLTQASGQKVSRDENGNVTITSEGLDSPVDEILLASDDQEDMVEAIVTVANQSVLLRAIVNPFTMRDRSVVAFQFEKVPGRFWGRGVAEKGFNPQKALDAEMRARVDALGFISSPMIAVDAGRVPRGFRMEVKPGKVWLTQGPPREVMSPVDIGQINPSTFNQTQELERMVQMGTGAFDTASQLKGGDANGPQAASLIMGAFVKRAKRAIRNVNDNLVEPLLKQTLWRYMQFAPRRYPTDYEFRIMATMGIVAREVEAMQLTQMIGMLPTEFPQISTAVAKGIVDLSSVHNKAEITQAMDAAMQPPSEEEQQKQAELDEMQMTSLRADAQGKLLTNQKTMAETRKLLGEALVAQRAADNADEKVDIEVQRLKAEMQQLEILQQQNQIALMRVGLEQKRIENETKKLNQGS